MFTAERTTVWTFSDLNVYNILNLPLKARNFLNSSLLSTRAWSMSAHHTSPRAQTRLADSVLIYVKSLLKNPQNCQLATSKRGPVLTSHSCTARSQMIPPVKKSHILITLENVTGHEVRCCCLRKHCIYRLCMWSPMMYLKNISLSSSSDSASLSLLLLFLPRSSLILPLIQSVIYYTICCMDPYPHGSEVMCRALNWAE